MHVIFPTLRNEVLRKSIIKLERSITFFDTGVAMLMNLRHYFANCFLKSRSHGSRFNIGQMFLFHIFSFEELSTQIVLRHQALSKFHVLDFLDRTNISHHNTSFLNQFAKIVPGIPFSFALDIILFLVKGGQDRIYFLKYH